MLPSRKDLEIPLLKALVQLGGQARPKDVYPLVAQEFPDIPKSAFKERLKSGRNRWYHRVHIARQELKEKGEIDSPAKGIWRITEKGRRRVFVSNEDLRRETYEYLKGALVTGKELKTTARIRRNEKILESVPKNQVSEWENKGYSVEREFRHKARVSKLKPIGERFENEIWLLMKQFGFSTLNRSSKFEIDVSIPSKAPRWEQIDVFAKDGDDHVFIIECKYSEKPSNRHRTLKSAIDNFAANDARIRDAIRRHFDDHKTKRLKVTYVIATRNMNWSDNILNAGIK